MKFQDLIVLLPCQSLEDFSLDRQADDAEEILSAYSALWHPALLASAQDVPKWVAAEDPPQEPADHQLPPARVPPHHGAQEERREEKHIRFPEREGQARQESRSEPDPIAGEAAPKEPGPRCDQREAGRLAHGDAAQDRLESLGERP